MDVQKQIAYWRSGADEDMAAARSLIENKHLRQGLFFAHLAIEKMLKAHVTRRTEDVPPRTHNLARLAEIAELSLSPKQKAFLREFEIYQLEGRYPDAGEISLDAQTAMREVSQGEEILRWLNRKL